VVFFSYTKGFKMATPEDVRQARLEADYEEMKSIRGDIISWQAFGTPPHEYVVTFNIRSFINTSLTREEHRIRIILSPSHPFEKPVVMMHEMVPIFHPHVWPDGKVCIGGWIIVRVSAHLSSRWLECSVRSGPDRSLLYRKL
jgi:ubiquitin-protein ligase